MNTQTRLDDRLTTVLIGIAIAFVVGMNFQGDIDASAESATMAAAAQPAVIAVAVEQPVLVAAL